MGKIESDDREVIATVSKLSVRLVQFAFRLDDESTVYRSHVSFVRWWRLWWVPKGVGSERR